MNGSSEGRHPGASSHDLFASQNIAREIRGLIDTANLGHGQPLLSPSTRQENIELENRRLSQCIVQSWHLYLFNKARQHLEETGFVQDPRLDVLWKETASKCEELDRKMASEISTSSNKREDAMREFDNLRTEIKAIRQITQDKELELSSKLWRTGKKEERNKFMVRQMDKDRADIVRHQIEITEQHTSKKLQIQESLSAKGRQYDQDVEILEKSIKALQNQIETVKTHQERIKKQIQQESNLKLKRNELETNLILSLRETNAAQKIQRAYRAFKIRKEAERKATRKIKKSKGDKKTANSGGKTLNGDKMKSKNNVKAKRDADKKSTSKLERVSTSNGQKTDKKPLKSALKKAR